jgi:hypothetical protein
MSDPGQRAFVLFSAGIVAYLLERFLSSGPLWILQEAAPNAECRICLDPSRPRIQLLRLTKVGFFGHLMPSRLWRLRNRRPTYWPEDGGQQVRKTEPRDCLVGSTLLATHEAARGNRIPAKSLPWNPLLPPTRLVKEPQPALKQDKTLAHTVF